MPNDPPPGQEWGESLPEVVPGVHPPNSFCCKCCAPFFLGEDSAITAGVCTVNNVHSAFESGDNGLVMSLDGDFEKFVALTLRRRPAGPSARLEP